MLFLSSRCHVLSFHIKAALGYHVHLCSMTPFIFGDEETIMSHLTKVTKRLRYQLTLRVISQHTKSKISKGHFSCLRNNNIQLFFIFGCNFTAEGKVQQRILYDIFFALSFFLCLFLYSATSWLHLNTYISIIKVDLHIALISLSVFKSLPRSYIRLWEGHIVVTKQINKKALRAWIPLPRLCTYLFQNI